MRPHNLTYTVIGAAMLWVGWFGFNAGSELASDDLAVQRVLPPRTSPPRRAAGLGALRMADRAASRACSAPLRRGRRAGLHHAGRRLRQSDAGDHHGRCRRHSSVHSPAASSRPRSATTTRWTPSASTASAARSARSSPACSPRGLPGTSTAANKLGLIEGGTVLTGQLVAVGVTWVFSIVGHVHHLEGHRRRHRAPRSASRTKRVGLDMSQHEEEGYIFT